MTPKRLKLIHFIANYIQTHGYAPSFEEMRQAMGIRSVSGIHAMLTSIESLGYVQRIPRNARAITLHPKALELRQAKVPPKHKGMAPERSPRRWQPPAITHTRSEDLLGRVDTHESQYRNVPFIGKIAAGSPIDVIAEINDYLPIPQHLCSPMHKHYVLQVEGDSMLEAGILPGDMAVISVQREAANGDIVVALIDQSEVTLKRFFQQGGNITLRPANKRHTETTLPYDRVMIQGRLRGILRTYT